MNTRVGRALAALALLAAGLAGTAAFSPSAGAAGTVVLSPASGPAGSTVSFSGSGCIYDDDSVEFTSDNIRAYFREISPASPAIGYGTVDTGSPDRAFSGTLDIPTTYFTPVGQEFPVTPGEYTIVFDCSTFAFPNPDMSVTFTVTGAGGTTTTTAPTTTPTEPPADPGGGEFMPPAEPPGDAEAFSTSASGALMPGGTLVIDEPGFVPGEDVPVVLYSDPVVLGTPTSTDSGNVAGSFTIPASTPPGQHHLALYGADTVKVLAVTIAAPSSPAPATPVRDIALTG